MSKPTVSVVCTAYNDPHNAEILYPSLAQQTYPIHEVIGIDNSDVTPVQDEILKHYPTAQVHSHPENLDFSKGSNTGIAHATGEYVFLFNSDMKLESNVIEEIVEYMEANPTIGAATPLLLRLDEGTIDTLGITGSKKRRFVNVGEGDEQKKWNLNEFDQPFGISGTAICFRRETITALIKNGGGGEHELFDEDFVAYKDDIDISYRMRHLGIQFEMVPSAVAYHSRTAQEKKQIKSARKARSEKSHRVNTYSLRNHWWTLLKNEPIANLIVHSPWILFYECQKLLFVLLFERRTLRILPSFFRGLPAILRKRRVILANSKIRAKDLRQFFR